MDKITNLHRLVGSKLEPDCQSFHFCLFFAEAPRRYEACGPPPHLANALIKSRSYSDRDFEDSRVGDYVNYACQPGYSLTGFNKVMCHSDGTWASAKMNSRTRDEFNQPASSLPTCQRKILSFPFFN